MSDKKINLHKELAMGLKSAEKEATGSAPNHKKAVKFAKGGAVKKVCPTCGKKNCKCKP